MKENPQGGDESFGSELLRKSKYPLIMSALFAVFIILHGTRKRYQAVVKHLEADIYSAQKDTVVWRKRALFLQFKRCFDGTVHIGNTVDLLKSLPHDEQSKPYYCDIARLAEEGINETYEACKNLTPLAELPNPPMIRDDELRSFSRKLPEHSVELMSVITKLKTKDIPPLLQGCPGK